jgi:hypothetical protein
VIAGIIFLALEIQQNNRLLSAEANFNLLQNRTNDPVVHDREVAEFWFRVNSGDELDDVDRYRVEQWVFEALLNWQWEWGQFNDGNLAIEELPIAAYRNAFFGRGITRQVEFAEVWERLKPTLNDEFVEFMTLEVITAGPL